MSLGGFLFYGLAVAFLAGLGWATTAVYQAGLDWWHSRPRKGSR